MKKVISYKKFFILTFINIEVSRIIHVFYFIYPKSNIMHRIYYVPSDFDSRSIYYCKDEPLEYDLNDIAYFQNAKMKGDVFVISIDNQNIEYR